MVSKYERKAQNELESEGWLIDYKRGMSRWVKMRDFWNTFDLVAYKPKKIRYIAIKGHAGGSALIALRKQIETFDFPHACTKELWRWPKRKKKEWVKEIIK